MSGLNSEWRPGFGTIYTWLAMDKYGRIAVMVNNCYGDLPKALLSTVGGASLLDELSEFIWEESSLVSVYPENKLGGAEVDLYSAWRYQNINPEDILNELQRDLVLCGVSSEFNLPVNKGLYVYHGVEGDNPGVDFPVGYSEASEMGDYFRFLVPTVFASIEDFPDFLRKGIAVSDNVDFSTDRLIKNDLINEYFSTMYVS